MFISKKIIKKNLFLNFIGLALLPVKLFNQIYSDSALIALIIVIIGVISFILIFIITKRLMDTLDQIAKVVRAVRYGDLTERVKIRAKGKVAKLAININKMIEALQDRDNKIKEYQREIQGQKEYLEALFNSLADGIITISQDCKILKINPTVALWIDLDEEDIIGKNLTDFLKCKCNVDCINAEDEICDICPLISQNERLSQLRQKLLT